MLLYVGKDAKMKGNIFNSYTFSVWRDDILILFTKVRSNLNEEEKDLETWIKNNAIELFGPTRSLKKNKYLKILILQLGTKLLF